MADSPVAELFRYHGRRMRSFLRRRLGTREDAEDASQEVFLRLLRRERAGALQADARAYLTTATHNVAIDVGRRRASHRQHERDNLDAASTAAEEAEAAEALFWREALRRLGDALNSLPGRTQQVFVLYHFEGQPHAAIARRLHMSIRSVERHMARAMAHCEAELREYVR